MSSDVVLSAALRSNLFSLQSTQSQIDTAQQRLATGLKVNSALDNPQNFFAAQSLQNRAGDLSSLLDGIGQSIRTVEEADKGVTALTSLVEQADSIATQALDALQSASTNAVATSSSSAVRSLGTAALSTITNIDGDEVFNIEAVGSGNFSVTLTSTTTLSSLVAEINDTASAASVAVEASVDTAGNLQIRSTNGNELILRDTGGTGTDGLQTLGLISSATESFTPGSTLNIDVTTSGGSVTEFTTLTSLTETTLDADTDNVLSFNVDGAGAVNFDATDTAATNIGAATISEFVDFINNDVAGLTATFDADDQQIQITAASTVSSFVVGYDDGTTATGSEGWILNDGNQTVLDATDVTFNTSTGAATAELSNLAADYDEVRSQIDSIVGDANYRGTNLLNGDDLVTYFNEDRTSSLTTSGTTFTSQGLGISAADFSGSTTINAAISEIRTALDTVRQFGSTLANDLAIIQTRKEFTESTIDTLNAGADDLTVADQNEEGANLLALQTRQQLGVTALSLAAQSQQSVLRLF